MRAVAAAAVIPPIDIVNAVRSIHIVEQSNFGEELEYTQMNMWVGWDSEW